MKTTIRVLDEKTINKIAAGEVVERPASVIKELVENSIDAGASAIEVEIIGGGSTYMRVSDNGSGMTEEDARLAVLRHATSKIQKVEDLFEISSLGFRGEALASISAVSHFVMITRRLADELGTKICMEGGRMVECVPAGTSPGTTIEVRDLFYNTPARKKFLKTERTEGGKIQEIVGRLALSNLHVAFKLIVETRVALVTPGNNSLADCMAALYGYKMAEDLFPVSYEAEGIIIEGMVGKPSLLKSNRQWQTIIVNNRIISDKTIYKAIDNAYHALLPKNGYPPVVISIVVPPHTVDINVHPRKSEVKFSDEQPVFKAVYHAVLRALENKTGLSEQIATEFRSEDKPSFSRPISDYRDEEGRRREAVKRTDDFISRLKSGEYPVKRKLSYVQESLGLSSREKVFPTSYTDEDKEKFSALLSETNEGNEKEEFSRSDRDEMSYEERFLPLGQVASCYIVAKKGNDLYLIDQHAAHERIRYDKLCRLAEDVPRQSLLLPVYVPATAEELDLMEKYMDRLEELGFSLEQGGPEQIRINEIPADLVESKAEEILRYVFSFLHDYQEPTGSQLRHEMIAYASCRGAIKAGHKLNTYQMAILIEELFATEKPYVCPHGRPTILRFTPEELGKLFHRD